MNNKTIEALQDPTKVQTTVQGLVKDLDLYVKDVLKNDNLGFMNSVPVTKNAPVKKDPKDDKKPIVNSEERPENPLLKKVTVALKSHFLQRQVTLRSLLLQEVERTTDVFNNAAAESEQLVKSHFKRVIDILDFSQLMLGKRIERCQRFDFQLVISDYNVVQIPEREDTNKTTVEEDYNPLHLSWTNE